ncbi:carbohydrate ABC transporter permease [Thermasporomyces composti]|uniref:Carbohydrate ABC transporter membrane protein 1 (CUT1 family) n=1 Tax=Thermasporomyces composti TaxID=696763 RepID=A0A3D9V035_THECX|nr:sugar ABC transporter permease [Thermasporomyces composti]REF34839.1 carbohydrate ABC transporter membrane protein 1 (CUT1 family) [Thermasporomyces composti]
MTATAQVASERQPSPTGRAAARRAWSPREKANLVKGLLFISPWIVGVLAFVAYPMVYSLAISLTKYSGMQAPEWFGLGNYVRLFQDPLAWTSIYNTLFYSGWAVPIGLVVALLLALAMNRNVREVAFYRTALYIPSLAPIFALSFIFIVLVNPGTGIVNQFFGLFGAEPRDYLADPTTAKLVIVATAQLGAGNAALIFLAGLNNIPQTLYEAARIDGANAFQSFTRITLPLLTPAILFNLITGISAGLQVFTQAYIMTRGGPNNGTLFYMYYLYKNAFSYAQLGYACALAVILFLVGVILAVAVYQVSRRFVHYDVTA